uniref:Reverse transcriptase/retrotransposon-derived protein RNase H-like domain-containing protein n=1 Tax=Tanacetum cinerariifolium TaxID=118510 RepID=A0A6L2KZQ3_TANCI|nr:hypothetical protein [Tanacetum cinerariifolium]
MHDGLRTESTSFRHHSSCRGKEQSSNSSEYPKQTIAIGSILTKERRKALCGLLRRNLDIFAWKSEEMTGVPRHLAEHRMNVREGCPPARQKKKPSTREKQGITRGSRKTCRHCWRMCVDFKDLNKACVIDGYPLLEIDWKVKSLYGYPFKCFLDAYKGYHQMKMVKDDEEKTTLITSQRSELGGVRRLSGNQSHTEQEIIKDIEEIFKTLREINMKINPKKCTFGIEEGMFMGYKVNAKGIKTTEVEAAFKKMKKLIVELRTLTILIEYKELIVYLAVAREAVSAVLMTEREAKQMPIYFVSRTLQGPEINYTPMEKLVLTLVHANKRLKRYFQAHPIIVIMDQPIKQVLSKPKITGSPPIEVKEGFLDPWTLFTDGSSCIDGFGVGLILTSHEGTKFTYTLKFEFDATKNEAEYEALIAGKVKMLANSFKKFSIKQVPRSENKKADALSKIAPPALPTRQSKFWWKNTPCKKEEGKGGHYKQYVLREIHEGSYNMHVGPRSVVAKAIRTRPFPKGPGKVKFLIVKMDYFTKWIEAKPVATITGNQIKKFAWDNIVCRFLALEWHLEEIHVTWAHFDKKQTRLRTYTKIHQEVLFLEREDGVIDIKRRCRDLSGDGVWILEMAVTPLKIATQQSTTL